MDAIETRLAAIEKTLSAIVSSQAELLLLVSQAAPTPVPVDPLPQWTKPADLHGPYKGSQGDSKSYAECRNRALYGIGWRGNHFLSGDWLDKAWDEVERIKKLDNATVRTYRQGLYANLNGDYACYAVLQGFIWTPEYQKLMAGYLMGMGTPPEDSSYTVEMYLDSQWGITGGPGIAGQ